MRVLFLAVIVVALMATSVSAAGPPQGSADYIVMLDFAQIFNASASAHKWTGQPDCDTWMGFICMNINNTRIYITQINIGNYDLHGVLPASMSNLTQLQVLTLPDNQVVGPIPDLSKSADTLKRLDFGRNPLNQSISDLGWMGSLKNKVDRLNMPNCGLYGSIPDSWANATWNELTLTNNNITGFFPPALASQATIVILANNYIQGNACLLFNGTIANSAGSCDLNNNYFNCTGCLKAGSKCCPPGGISTKSGTPPTTSSTLVATTAITIATATTATTATTTTLTTTSATTTTATTSTTRPAVPGGTCSSDLSGLAGNVVGCNDGTWNVNSSATNNRTVIVEGPDIININGSYTQGSSGSLVITANGTRTPIVVDQNATLGGSLVVVVNQPINGTILIPIVNASNIEGQFSDVQLQYTAARCEKVQLKPIYGNTGTFMQLTSKRGCSSGLSNTNKKIVIGVASGVGALILISVIIIAIVLLLKKSSLLTRKGSEYDYQHSSNSKL